MWYYSCCECGVDDKSGIVGSDCGGTMTMVVTLMVVIVMPIVMMMPVAVMMVVDSGVDSGTKW